MEHATYTLPTILAGPIVRRSTPERVHVWLATSVPLASDSTYVKMFDHSKGFKRIAVNSEITSVWLGLQLYIHIIAVTPEESTEGELPVNVPILYDVILSNRGLTDFPGLDNLTLPGFILPSFVLADPAVLQVHTLYASCRKLHGPPADMMPAVAKALKGAANRRPRYLFLTGDQIYADDVDGNIIRYVHNLGIRVVGGGEQIPGLPSQLGPDSSRGRYLEYFVHSKKKPVFTSGEKDFHLLTFGDYAAMHLLAWNDEVWGLNLPPGVAKKLRPFLDARFARRALANVVTYMIFDDHEITDDWFRTPEWRERALSNRSARRIITNGLVAYWAFQGWGNDPSGFSASFRQLMSDFALGKYREEEAQNALLEPGRWSYLAPTPVPTLFLDTRTGRAGNNPEVCDGLALFRIRSPLVTLAAGHSPKRVMRNPETPRLLGPQERERLSKLLAENAMKNEPLMGKSQRSLNTFLTST